MDWSGGQSGARTADCGGRLDLDAVDRPLQHPIDFDRLYCRPAPTCTGTRQVSAGIRSARTEWPSQCWEKKHVPRRLLGEPFVQRRDARVGARSHQSKQVGIGYLPVAADI